MNVRWTWLVPPITHVPVNALPDSLRGIEFDSLEPAEEAES